MQKIRIVLLTTLLSTIIFSLSNSISTQSETLTLNTDSNCIVSFERFAHSGPRNEDVPLMLPNDSWVVDNTFLAYLDENNLELPELSYAHFSHINQELWLLAGSGIQSSWIAYIPESGTFSNIPATLDYSDRLMMVSEVYSGDTDGNIWGIMRPFAGSGSISGQNTEFTYPLLAKLDNDSLQFEPVTNALAIAESESVVVQFDGADTFWLLVANDGIYSFSASSEQITRVVEIPNLRPPIYAAMGHDRTLYFQILQEGLFRVVTEENGLVELGQPENSWPVNRGIWVDRANNVWLGSVGYRTPNGDWNLIHSDVEGYSERTMEYIWASPSPVLESSDNRIWFTNWWDGGIYYLGTAWYAPSIGQGCMFTNLFASLVEDSNQQLWMVAGGILYTAHLSDL